MEQLMKMHALEDLNKEMHTILISEVISLNKS